MKTRATLVQLGLAAAGLLAAYATWQRPQDRPAAEITVLDVPAARVESVRFENGERWSELRRDADGRVWVRLAATRAIHAPAPDGAPPGAGDAAALLLAGSPERELVGNATAERLFAQLAPLKASRALGVLGGPGLEEVGLAGTRQRLRIREQGLERAFQVSTSVLGLTSPYLRRESDGQVYLLGPGLVSELDGAASRLVDRRLQAFLPGDFDALVIERDGARREWAQREGAQGPRLSAPGAHAPDERVSLWHDRLWRAAPVEVLGRGEVPTGGAPPIAFRLEYRRDGAPVGFMEVGLGADGRALARTGHTAGWVALSPGAAALLEEGAQLVTAGP